MIKTLSPKAFKVILIALLVTIAMEVISMIVTLTTLDDTIAAQMLLYEEMLNGMSSEAVEELVRGIVMFSMVIGIIIFGLIYGLFVYFLLKHRKQESKGTYLTVLFVFAVIGAIFNTISLIGSFSDIPNLLLSLIGLATNIAIIYGHSLQKKYAPPTASSPPSPYGY